MEEMMPKSISDWDEAGEFKGTRQREACTQRIALQSELHLHEVNK